MSVSHAPRLCWQTREDEPRTAADLRERGVAMTPSESTGGRLTAFSFAVLCLLAGSCRSHAGESDAAMKENDVRPWYEAFDRNDPALLDAILSKDWQDIPAAPGQPAGPAGAKLILAEL